jgi:phospholipid/cholesterol/gamma-HCH transport system substrate-binding protein
MRGPIHAYRGHAATFAVFVALAAGFLVWYIGLGGGLPSLRETYRVQALMPMSGSLTAGARVTMAGAKVGRITEVRRQGVAALVSMQLEDDRVTPIPRDTRVALRERTPVGENYLTLFPGRSRATLASGDTLPMTQADEHVDIDQLLSVLQGQTRGRARQMIQALGASLDGQGARLNDLVGGVAGALADGSHVVRVLADDRAQVGRLVEQLGDLARAVGDRGAAVQQLGHQALVTFRAIGGQDDDLRRLLDGLPPTLSQVRKTSTTVRSVTKRATPVLADLAVAVRQVRPAVRRLRPAAQEGRGVVRELGVAAPPLRQTLGRLQGLSSPLAAALPDLHETLCQVNPVLRYAKPYIPDLTSFIVGMGSAANSYDALGHLIRLTPIISENTLVGLPPDASAAAHTLLHAGLLGKSKSLNWNPYPRPGEMGKSSAAGKSILGPDALGKSGFRYPRITADC